MYAPTIRPPIIGGRTHTKNLFLFNLMRIRAKICFVIPTNTIVVRPMAALMVPRMRAVPHCHNSNFQLRVSFHFIKFRRIKNKGNYKYH